MNLVEITLEKVIKKDDKSYGFDENVYKELIKAIVARPSSMDYVLYTINMKLSTKPIHFKVVLFELIDRLFIDVTEFRMPFIKILQKSMGHIIGMCKNETQNSIDSVLKRTIISKILNWNDRFGKDLLQIGLCLNFIRSKHKTEVENLEKNIRNEKLRKQRRSQLNSEEKERNYQHLMAVYEDHKHTIKASLKTIESCYNLLIPNILEESAQEASLSGPCSPVAFPVMPINEMPIEFSGPSTRYHGKLKDDIPVDLSLAHLGIEIIETMDNKDLLATLKEEIGVLQKKFVPLLNNIMKKLKALGNYENDLKTISELCWEILNSLKKFDKIKIIQNDCSATLLSSDSEQDDDFIDVL